MTQSLLILVTLTTSAWQGPNPAIQQASEQDRQQMLDQLKITEPLRKGANGSNKDAPNYANYDESKANPYPTLPDPLVMNNGKKVSSAKDWWNKRRPEVVELFDREIYGRMPKVTPKVNWEVLKTTEEKNGDFAIITKNLIGHVDNSSYPDVKVEILLNLTTPADAKGPVPVIMELGFVLPPGGIPGGRGRGPGPGAAPTGPTWQQQVLARGQGPS